MLYGSNSTEVKSFFENLNVKGRDASWFDLSGKNIVGWSIIPNIACSAMQDFGDDVRIITRCYIQPQYRTKGLQHDLNAESTYVFTMIKEQLHYAMEFGFNNAFISTEGNRRAVIKRHARIAKEKYNLNCELLEGKYRTCEGPNCIQNIGLYKLTENEFGLPKVE